MSIDRLTSFGNEEDQIAGNGKKKKKPKSAYEEGVEGWEINLFWRREITCLLTSV